MFVFSKMWLKLEHAILDYEGLISNTRDLQDAKKNLDSWRYFFVYLEMKQEMHFCEIKNLK